VRGWRCEADTRRGSVETRQSQALRSLTAGEKDDHDEKQHKKEMDKKKGGRKGLI